MNILKKVYYDYGTQNKSFVEVSKILKDKGIKNNNFFLLLLDTDLHGVDPYDGRLSKEMKNKIYKECKNNYWYFIREVVRIMPRQVNLYISSNGKFEMFKNNRYKLNLTNLAMNYCAIAGIDCIIEAQRNSKSYSTAIRLAYEILFYNTEINMYSRTNAETKAKFELIELIISNLPEYLTKRTIELKELKNVIKSRKIIKSNMDAILSGKDMKQPRIWFDDFSATPYNGIMLQSCIESSKVNRRNNIRNNKPAGIIITSSTGDKEEYEGCFYNDLSLAGSMNINQIKYFYDKPIEEIREKNKFIFIKYDSEESDQIEIKNSSLSIKLS